MTNGPTTTAVLDLDGVCADFVSAALAANDASWAMQMAGEKQWPRDLETMIGKTTEQFWDAIDSDSSFWQSVPAYPWLDDLISFLDDAFDELVIATQCNRSVDCPSGKAEWIREHIGDRETFLLWNPGQKSRLATSCSVLIDDHPANCKAFESAGGFSVLWPSPSNQAPPTLRAVSEAMQNIAGCVSFIDRAFGTDRVKPDKKLAS